MKTEYFVAEDVRAGLNVLGDCDGEGVDEAFALRLNVLVYLSGGPLLRVPGRAVRHAAFNKALLEDLEELQVVLVDIGTASITTRREVVDLRAWVFESTNGVETHDLYLRSCSYRDGGLSIGSTVVADDVGAVDAGDRNWAFVFCCEVPRNYLALVLVLPTLKSRVGYAVSNDSTDMTVSIHQGEGGCQSQ